MKLPNHTVLCRELEKDKMYRSIYLFFLLAGVLLKAQSSGVIYGNITDDTGFPVMADIFIDGTIYSTYTDENGSYLLEVEEGTYPLVVSSFGYEEVISEISISQGERIEFSIVLKSENTMQLSEAVVIGQTNKETETALLNEQKKSVTITENIGAKELERKGVSDIATAVTKVSGISRQEGSNVVYVRGLGDRYNSTTMNGLPIPSNDPEYKNMDLSILSTDIVGFIGIDKVYSGTFFGDFAGGNVNIVPKKQTGKGFFSFGMTARGNSNALKDENFKLQSGINWMGFDKAKNPLTLSSFAFENSLNPKNSGSLGSGFSFSGGESFRTGETGKIGLFATAGFDSDYTSIEEGFLRSGVSVEGDAKGKDFEQYDAYTYTTSTTGLLNLFYQTNRRNLISFNSLFVNSSSQKLEEGSGYMRDNANEGGMLRRGTFVQNTLWVNQLLGEHKFGERTELNWAVGYNSITSDMPDRFQNIVEWKSELNHYVVAGSSASLNHRYFQVLDENEIAGNMVFNYKFAKNPDLGYKGKLTVGYNGRFKNREFEAMQYNLRPASNQSYADFNNMDGFFNQASFEAGLFEIRTFSGATSIEPQFYNGEQNIHGGFLNLEYKLSPKFTAVIGLRGEYVSQLVEWNTSLDPAGNENELEEFQFLPSLNLKYELTEKQNLRFAASKTYTLPQFKERALFMYEDLGETVYGWPTTYASTDYNADLKWELFPGAGELISVAAFGKYIENPINKFTVTSSTYDVSYANTGDWGYAVGGELELRKSLFRTHTNNPVQLTAGANISYIHTHQELNNEKVFNETLLSNGKRMNADFTNTEDAFQGASDLLLNGDLTFIKDWERGGNLMATIAYNHFSDRIYALGSEGKGNIVEKGFGTLDFILRTKVSENIGINFNARNLLNPDIDRVQENADRDITVLHYKKGMNFSLGINYQF